MKAGKFALSNKSMYLTTAVKACQFPFVKHGFVDGRKGEHDHSWPSVDVNGSVGWSDEACFRFALFFVRTRKKECNQSSGGQCLPICLF